LDEGLSGKRSNEGVEGDIDLLEHTLRITEAVEIAGKEVGRQQQYFQSV